MSFKKIFRYTDFNFAQSPIAHSKLKKDSFVLKHFFALVFSNLLIGISIELLKGGLTFENIKQSRIISFSLYRSDIFDDRILTLA